jgi:acyl-CoA synthetase (AMP-forming)/AMP-acid ligase II
MIPSFTHDTLRGLYARACRWRGAQDFFADPALRLTGEQAWRSSAGLANAFAARGMDAGAVVAFLCKPSAAHGAAWFAVPLGGGIACSLHARETPQRLGETLAWLDAAILVHDDDLAELAHAAVAVAAAAGARISALTLDAALAAATAARGDALAVPVHPDDLAAIILSSGSTGRPKGVMHTHRTLVENAKAGQALYGTVTSGDAALVMMQPSFAAWVNVVLPYVGGHGKVVFDSTFSPARFLATLERESITMAPAVPTMWRMILAEDTARYDLSAMKNVSISGEPPARSDLEAIRALICAGISVFYCSSESGTAGAVLATERETLGKPGTPGKPATTGRPVVGGDIRIIDPDGSFDDELPPGSIGEIAVSGASLAVGYWKDDALTRASFRDGWWRSGDMGRIDADGDLVVEGRRDNVINTGGVKVHGEEVERALLAHPAVSQAAVVGRADLKWGHRVEAYVVLRAGATADAAALDAFCREAGGLAGYKVPKAFHFVERLPTGPTGKLYRRALRERE